MSQVKKKRKKLTKQEREARRAFWKQMFFVIFTEAIGIIGTVLVCILIK